MTSTFSIMIATRDRLEDLRRTLKDLRGLDSYADTTLVIDDGSEQDLGVLRPEFSSVKFLRFDKSEGQSKRRSQAFELLETDFILQLDDDSAPVEPSCVLEAVRFLDRYPHIGVLALHIFNGPELPQKLTIPEARYHHSFVGCGVLFRSVAIQQVGGYQSFFQNEWEEEELALHLIKAGWAIYFFPDILIHHQVSPTNRSSARTWMRGFRNKIWAMIMHYPMHRLVMECSWVLGIACLDSIRLARPHYLLRGIWECLVGLPRAFRMRAPMSRLAMARYDALRFRGIYTENEFRNPPRIGWPDFRRWVRNWWNRPRQRSFWDWRKGDTGSCETVSFAHEHKRES